MANIPGSTSTPAVPTTSTTMQVSSGPSFPITNYMAPASASGNVSANGTVLKTAPAGVMQLPSGFTFMPGREGGLPPWDVLSVLVTSWGGFSCHTAKRAPSVVPEGHFYAFVT